MKRFLGPFLLTCALCSAQSDAVGNAVQKLNSGDVASAEQILRDDLKLHPRDAVAAGVLAVVLDQQKRYDEAALLFQRALASGAADPALWNNYGNHLLLIGRVSEARDAFRKVLTLQPGHVNARLQLAAIAVRDKQIPDARRYLAGLEQSADARFYSQLGEVLAGAGEYRRAERVLEKVVDADPSNAKTTYELGLAASHAGDWGIAQKNLLRVAELQPDNAAALYDLAVADRQMKQEDAATDVAAKACRLDPKSVEAHRLLAELLTEEGYFADASAAWNQYVSLAPADEAGRRERAFAQAAVAPDARQEVSELAAYVDAHPKDAMGHYELALAMGSQVNEDVKRELDRALELDPHFASAHLARGLWLSKHGQNDLALRDFQVAAERQSENPHILDRLAEAYVAVGKPDRALPLLARAGELAPDDATITLHLARERLKQGDTAAAQDLIARVRRLRATARMETPSEGLLAFLQLTPQERMAKYKAGVEKAASTSPQNAEAQSRYVALLSEEGPSSQLDSVCQHFSQLGADAVLVASAARAVLSAESPSLSCASSLLASGLKQDAQNKELLALQRLEAELAQAGPHEMVEAKSSLVR